MSLSQDTTGPENPAARRTAVIVGSGDFTDRGLTGKGAEPYDLLIAADGGLAALQKAGLVPDVIIGDFDSLGYVPGGEAEIIVLPREKDDTDMAAACRAAWEQGCRDLRIYGGSGSRPDHFLANLQLAAHYSRQGGTACLTAPGFTVYALTDGGRTLKTEPGTTFSVFSHGDSAEGVSITGDAKYRVSEITLTNTRAVGVSNEATGRQVRVSVRKGTLLIFLYTSPEAAE